MGVSRACRHVGLEWNLLFLFDTNPDPLQMQEEIQLLLEQITVWKGRPLEGKVAIRTLHSDSSDIMWAGVDLKSGQKFRNIGGPKLHYTSQQRSYWQQWRL